LIRYGLAVKSAGKFGDQGRAPIQPAGASTAQHLQLVKAGFIEIRHANGQARQKARKADSIILMLACAAR
jgi:hypothetical protein